MLAYNKPLLFAVKGSARGSAAHGERCSPEARSETSLVAPRTEQLVAEVLPEDLVQVAIGGAEVAKLLARHPCTRRLAFTGAHELRSSSKRRPPVLR